MVLRHVP